MSNFTISDCGNPCEFHPIYWMHRFEFLSHELICNQYCQELPNTEFNLSLYLNLIFDRSFGFRHFFISKF